MLRALRKKSVQLEPVIFEFLHHSMWETLFYNIFRKILLFTKPLLVPFCIFHPIFTPLICFIAFSRCRCLFMKLKMPMILDTWWSWRELPKGYWTSAQPFSLEAKRNYWTRKWRKPSTMLTLSLEVLVNVC